MGKMKDLVYDIRELLEAGFWPVDIVKRVPGATMEMVLEVEDEMYANEQHNIGPDYE